jgi:hypothetical protein
MTYLFGQISQGELEDAHPQYDETAEHDGENGVGEVIYLAGDVEHLLLANTGIRQLHRKLKNVVQADRVHAHTHIETAARRGAEHGWAES